MTEGHDSDTSRVSILRGGRHWMALFGAWLLLNMALEVFEVIEVHPVTVGMAGLILIGEAYYDKR